MNATIEEFLDQVETYVVGLIDSIQVDKTNLETYTFFHGLCFVHAMDNATSVFLQPMNPLQPNLLGVTLPVPGTTAEKAGGEIIRLLGFTK